MSGNRPDLHTPQHDQWDQGGHCNNLVIDDDGCGTVCGYRAPRDYTPTDGEVLTAVVLYRAIASADAPPPTIDTIATPEETARYLGEYQRWLAKHDAQVCAETLREAADVVHAEARWQMEQKMRGAVQMSGAETAVDRFLVLETLLRERAGLIEREAGI